MTEIARTPLGVVTASAGTAALDALVLPGRAFPCRVADDELLLLSAPEVTDGIERDVATRLGGLDPDAVVIDTSDGWSAVTITDPEVGSMFGVLSRLEPPGEGFVQGEVVHVPAKVVVEPGRLLVVVPAMWEAHLLDRTTRALGVRERTEPIIWTAPPR